MANRPQGFGMTAEVAAKIAGKYDASLDAQARDWINQVTEPEEELAIDGNPDTLHEGLKDGVLLCKLINVICPGSVNKVNTSKMAFKQMENIGKFLDACETYGVNKLDLFQTVSLYEATNMPQVIDGIHALGRKAGSKGFSPSIGAKESQQNKREFTDEQLQAGKGVIGLQMGSNKGASQAGMDYGKPRQIAEQ
ncbi:transgelin-3-like [Halichondria panicea]